jgi:hypothetical protein
MDSSMEKVNGGVGKDHNVTPMKVTMPRIRKMDMGYSNGQVGIFTRENTEKMKEMGLEK